MRISRPRQAHAAAVLVAAAALALAGCAGERKPERHTIEIHNFAFVPATVTVHPGDELLFLNRDGVPHTATAAGHAWDTGNIAANGSAVVRVAAAGSYRCEYHPTMTGNVALAK